MPAARKRSRSLRASKIRSSAIAVCTMQSGFSAKSASMSLVAATPKVAGESGQLSGVVADLVRVGDVDPDQLELGMGVDARQGVSPDVAGAPLHDAVRHGMAP